MLWLFSGSEGSQILVMPRLSSVEHDCCQRQWERRRSELSCAQKDAAKEEGHITHIGTKTGAEGKIRARYFLAEMI